MPFPLLIGVLMLKMTSKMLSQKLGKLILFVVMMEEPDRLDVHCRCFLHFYFRKMIKLAKIYNRWLTFSSAEKRFARWTNSVSCLTFFRSILVASPTFNAICATFAQVRLEAPNRSRDCNCRHRHFRWISQTDVGGGTGKAEKRWYI